MSESAPQHDPDHGHEPIGANVRLITLAMAGLGMLVVLAIGVVYWINYGGRDDQPQPPLTTTMPAPRLSEPPLDPDQHLQLLELRAEENHQLDSYGWIDREAGIARIPILQAMERIAADGLPQWPASPDNANTESPNETP